MKSWPFFLSSTVSPESKAPGSPGNHWSYITAGVSLVSSQSLQTPQSGCYSWEPSLPSPSTSKLENSAFRLGSEHSSPRGPASADYAKGKATGRQAKVDIGKQGQEVLT